MKQIRYYVVIVFLIGLITSCVKDDYQLYDASQTNRIYFAVDSVDFIYGAKEDRSCDLEIPIKLIGLANMDENAEFKVYADNVRSTAKSEVHYQLDEKQIFMKDSVTAVVRLDFNKQALIKEMKYILYLYLEQNENYRPTNKTCCVVEFGDVTLAQPAWWMPDRLGTFSQEKLVLFIKYFHETEEITPVLFNQIKGLWGEYLDNVSHDRYPWLLTTYTYVGYFTQYIYVPMYDYYLKTGDELYRIPNPMAN